MKLYIYHTGTDALESVKLLAAGPKSSEWFKIKKNRIQSTRLCSEVY